MNNYQKLMDMLEAQWPDNKIINFVFLGDSITAGYRDTPRIVTQGSYPAQFMLWLNRTFPTALVNQINAGVGGWGVEDGLKTLETNVLTHNPDFVTICYGMNDFLKGSDYLSHFKSLYLELIDKLRTSKVARVMLLTTIPYFDGTEEGRSILEDSGVDDFKGVQSAYMDTIVQISMETGLPVADVFRKWNSEILKLDSPGILYSNGINHPNERGHTIIAETLIEKFLDIRQGVWENRLGQTSI